MLALMKGPVKSSEKWAILAKQCRQIHPHADLQGLLLWGCPRHLPLVPAVKLPAHVACGTALLRENSKKW